MRRGTGSRHEALQAALVDAAEKVIAAEGLGALRARTLAEVVGCSVGAIYTIFPDLSGVVLAVNGRTLGAIDGVMGAVEEGEPETQLVRLAGAYLDYAVGARLRWGALFLHSVPRGEVVPEWYARLQGAAFSHIEGPLGRLCPGLEASARRLLARSLFAAVHGMVALGLDEKVAAMPLAMLHEQVAIVVRAAARGLAVPAG